MSMFMGTFVPLMEDVHDLKNETSTIFSVAAITENFVPWILQHGFNCKVVYSIHLGCVWIEGNGGDGSLLFFKLRTM